MDEEKIVKAEEEKTTKSSVCCAGKEKYLIIGGILVILAIALTVVMAKKQSNGSIIPKSTFPVSKNAVSSKAVVPQATVLFVPQSVTLKKGDKSSVDVSIDFQKELRLDGLDLLLVFDPKLIEVSEVVPSKLFSSTFIRQEELAKGRISVTFLEENGGGILVNSKNKILSFTLKGKAKGAGSIEIVSAEKGATTVITESNTSKKVPFDTNNLKVVVE